MDAKLFSHFLTLLIGDFSIGNIAFVAHKYFDDLLIGVGFYLFKPVLERLKGSKIVNGVSHYDSHRSLVVGLSNGLKSLLSSRVPDLQPYLLILDLQCLDLEVDS